MEGGKGLIFKSLKFSNFCHSFWGQFEANLKYKARNHSADMVCYNYGDFTTPLEVAHELSGD